jgi:hypothetical protein
MNAKMVAEAAAPAEPSFDASRFDFTVDFGSLE